MRLRDAVMVLALSVSLPGCAALDTITGQGIDPSTRLFESTSTWTDEEGVPATLARWRGSSIVMTAFYGSCTERCPMTISKLQEVDEALRAQGRSAEFVLITIDPDHDSVERLRRLKESRHLPASWHLLRGSREDTLRFTKMLRLHVARDVNHMDHDVKIAMFDAEGSLVHSFSGWQFANDEAVARVH